MDGLIKLAEEAGVCLQRQKRCLSLAESCTGGWISQAVTSIPGSSQWFDRGFVTYSNQAKEDMLGVSTETLLRYGAVSEETVTEMLNGLLQHSLADVVVAVSGVAGPSGGSVDKPVGTVVVGCMCRSGIANIRRYQFSGDRQAIRYQTVEKALLGVINAI
jgi:nicotinamide-nucleotide amidase